MNQRLMVLALAVVGACPAYSQNQWSEEEKARLQRHSPELRQLQRSSDWLENKRRALSDLFSGEKTQEQMAREAEEERNNREEQEARPKSAAELQQEREEAQRRQTQHNEGQSAARQELMTRVAKTYRDCKYATSSRQFTIAEAQAECKPYADALKQCPSAGVDCERMRRELKYATPDELLGEAAQRISDEAVRSATQKDEARKQAEREARRKESEEVMRDPNTFHSPAPSTGWRKQQSEQEALRKKEDEEARRRQDDPRWRQQEARPKQPPGQTSTKQPAEQPQASAEDTKQIINFLGAVAAGAAQVEANRRQAAAASGGSSGSPSQAQPAGGGCSNAALAGTGRVCTAR
ncbi:hypothetical protein [Ramlibacter sp. Leaf400]|uniref:hypothetical protein n=1 Tax=Ramlibacter sp. Leaf400 TaxID=1736365 RepID=UPI0012E33BCA|nr:hypothetical protein [Ramlibacter sp. Leaf400]